MIDEHLYPPPLDRLRELGPLFYSWGHDADKHDYVAELGLTAEHVPGLVRIARLWLDTLAGSAPAEPELWAPIHAWRALGQLRVVEAVEPLLAMLDDLAEADDDWFMEELPGVFGQIGPDAIESLERYLVDPSHTVYPRAAAGDSLPRMVDRHPECRDAAIAAVASGLAGYEENDIELNAFFVSDLLRLKAVEEAELIERAFAADRVEDEICGCWGNVRKELGVEGLGLAPDRPTRPRPRPESLRVDPPEHLSKQERIRRRKQQQKLKAQKKQRQKARKKNRKAK